MPKTNYTLYAKWEHLGTFSFQSTNVTGSKVTFTIVRDIPDSAVPSSETQNVYIRTLNIASSNLGNYFKDATYVDNGKGTNALVFEVTAKNDISVGTVQDIINRYLVFTESKIGGDFASNIGTLKATVKDYHGN